MTDPFAHDDAAYLLGALNEAERTAFEEHLAGCAECQARLDEIRPTAGLLADLTIADLAEAATADAGPPDTLLPALLASVRRERRRRWMGVSVAGLAAACIVALVLVVTSDRSSNRQAPAQAMHALVATPVHATAQLDGTAWGTRISLACQYDVSYLPDAEYALVVTDRSGGKHPAGSWHLVRSATTHFTGGTAVARNDIARIDVTVGNTSVLELDL